MRLVVVLSLLAGCGRFGFDDVTSTGDGSAGSPDAAVMARGAAIYSDACASCHMADGSGQARFFAPLDGMDFMD